ncbi:hypothetical protein C1Y63_02740 [Corynebacterium sp. 13CS0277]|uniref:copper transporter n=1 Tax=Corynebacterium sp. 13CS0277 TaxID=2071994 RepID=UPI000D03A6F7|nr:copper transporter [Corynebacterium sp. 13CS0277]PRQ12012.1 hypothetical protein C1Y63_02740 [Corynebacterium sp. 13CS0277]
MGSMRPGHVFAGVTLGMAAGVAAGALLVAPNLADGGNAQLRDTSSQLKDLKTSSQVVAAEADAADSFIASTAPAQVAGILDGKPVTVIRTASAQQEDVDAVEALLRDAKAVDAGRLKLTEKFFDKEHADRLKSIVATTLPAGAKLSVDKLDPGTHAGEALGAALFAPKEGQPASPPEDRALLLNALQGAGLVEANAAAIAPAEAIVIITGDAEEGNEFAARNLAAFALALGRFDGGAVLAGRITQAATTGAIGVVRSDAADGLKVSTIDSVNMAYGRLATVLAVREQLDGSSGAYGAAASAEAASPPVPRT